MDLDLNFAVISLSVKMFVDCDIPDGWNPVNSVPMLQLPKWWSRPLKLGHHHQVMTTPLRFRTPTQMKRILHQTRGIPHQTTLMTWSAKQLERQERGSSTKSHILTRQDNYYFQVVFSNVMSGGGGMSPSKEIERRRGMQDRGGGERSVEKFAHVCQPAATIFFFCFFFFSFKLNWVQRYFHFWSKFQRQSSPQPDECDKDNSEEGDKDNSEEGESPSRRQAEKGCVNTITLISRTKQFHECSGCFACPWNVTFTFEGRVRDNVRLRGMSATRNRLRGGKQLWRRRIACNGRGRTRWWKNINAAAGRRTTDWCRSGNAVRVLKASRRTPEQRQTSVVTMPFRKVNKRLQGSCRPLMHVLCGEKFCQIWLCRGGGGGGTKLAAGFGLQKVGMFQPMCDVAGCRMHDPCLCSIGKWMHLDFRFNGNEKYCFAIPQVVFCLRHSDINFIELQSEN